MGQREKWTPLSSLLCCRAYVEASMDAKRGNSQKSGVFTARVGKVYQRLLSEHEKRGEHFEDVEKERSASAVAQRYRKVKEACLKFEEHRQRVDAMCITGNPTEQDLIRITTASFYGDIYLNGQEKTNVYRYIGSDPVQPKQVFPHMKCYLWLRTTCFWNQLLFTVQSTRESKKHQLVGAQSTAEDSRTGNIPPSDEVIHVDMYGSDSLNTSSKQCVPDRSSESKATPTKSVRPSGTKRTLETAKIAQALFKGADGIADMAAESKRLNQIKQEMLEIKKRETRMALFQMEGTNPELFRSYREREQQLALRELESNGESLQSVTISPLTGTKSNGSTSSAQNFSHRFSAPAAKVRKTSDDDKKCNNSISSLVN